MAGLIRAPAAQHHYDGDWPMGIREAKERGSLEACNIVA